MAGIEFRNCYFSHSIHRLWWPQQVPGFATPLFIEIYQNQTCMLLDLDVHIFFEYIENIKTCLKQSVYQW